MTRPVPCCGQGGLGAGALQGWPWRGGRRAPGTHASSAPGDPPAGWQCHPLRSHTSQLSPHRLLACDVCPHSAQASPPASSPSALGPEARLGWIFPPSAVTVNCSGGDSVVLKPQASSGVGAGLGALCVRPAVGAHRHRWTPTFCSGGLLCPGCRGRAWRRRFLWSARRGQPPRARPPCLGGTGGPAAPQPPAQGGTVPDGLLRGPFSN